MAHMALFVKHCLSQSSLSRGETLPPSLPHHESSGCILCGHTNCCQVLNNVSNVRTEQVVLGRVEAKGGHRQGSAGVKCMEAKKEEDRGRGVNTNNSLTQSRPPSHIFHWLHSWLQPSPREPSSGLVVVVSLVLLPPPGAGHHQHL